MRIRGWSKLSSAELWAAWLAEFPTHAEAEASAVWIANRLVKHAARSTRARFYEVKDMFLRRYSHSLIEGRMARVEQRECRGCGGDGKDFDSGFDCERCEGTGIYSERILYVHYLEIAGTRYSFHSYTKPALLCDLSGEDKESYGGRFTDEEIAELKLPLSGLVRMLRWAAFNGWAAPVGSPHENINSRIVESRMEVERCHCAAWPGRKAGGHHEYCRIGMSA